MKESVNLKSKTNIDLKSKTNEELFREYKGTSDFSIKQELTMRYSVIVKKIAISMRSTYINLVDVEDVVNEGIIQLMNSIERFDVDKNIKFETYISKRIKGMVIDIIRKEDWVPRSVRQRAREVEENFFKLEEMLGREPTPMEVAEKLDMTLDEYQRYLRKANIYNIVSIDQSYDNNEDGRAIYEPENTDESIMPEKQLEKKETVKELTKAIGTLKKKEQLVISLYYKEGLTMKEISQIMELTEARVSQIHSKAIAKMKKVLEK